jgi:hypothetical protein
MNSTTLQQDWTRDVDDAREQRSHRGTVTREGHEMGIQRMTPAGAVRLTWGVLSAEWQRDWAHETTVPGLAQIVVEHYGATGTSFLRE